MPYTMSTGRAPCLLLLALTRDILSLLSFPIVDTITMQIDTTIQINAHIGLKMNNSIIHGKRAMAQQGVSNMIVSMSLERTNLCVEGRSFNEKCLQSDKTVERLTF